MATGCSVPPSSPCPCSAPHMPFRIAAGVPARPVGWGGCCHSAGHWKCRAVPCGSLGERSDRGSSAVWGGAELGQCSPLPAHLLGRGSGFAEVARPPGPHSGWTKGRHCCVDEAGVISVDTVTHLSALVTVCYRQREVQGVSGPRVFLLTPVLPEHVLLEKCPHVAPGPFLHSPDPPPLSRVTAPFCV